MPPRGEVVEQAAIGLFILDTTPLQLHLLPGVSQKLWYKPPPSLVLGHSATCGSSLP